jgi:hypothetical protein
MDLVERRIQGAIDHGDFDDLPGHGKPHRITDTGPGWFVRRTITEYRTDGIRDRVDEMIERIRPALWALVDEDEVRTTVDAVNRMLTGLGTEPLDPDELIREWRAMARLRS